MRSQKPILIATCLAAWICITYLLWSRQNNSSPTALASSSYDSSSSSSDAAAALEPSSFRELYRRLNQLEADVQRELLTNRQLVQQLLTVVRGIDRLNALEAQEVRAAQQEANAAAAAAKLASVDRQLSVADLPLPIRAAATAAAAAAASAAASSASAANRLSPQLNPIASVVAPGLAAVSTSARPISVANSSTASSRNFSGPIIPILVFACNRPSVARCLDSLLRYRPNERQFPIIVSQDCADAATRNIIRSYRDVRLIVQPDQSEPFVPPKERKFRGYYKIARHYGWALNETFRAGYEFVVIVEDDLEVAPDFFEYFAATYRLLRDDESLWCVSAWNDNGKAAVIDGGAAELLYRTDFFPGLGWMLSRRLWTEELSAKWPVAFWDDWIRQPQQRRERACIRPEVSRTRTFGKVGVSNGMFFEKHLRYIKLSEDFVPFTKRNLSGLRKAPYDEQFLAQVYGSAVVTFDELRRGIISDGSQSSSVRIQYNTKEQYKRTAKMLGLMDDFKSGVPRTGYRGIVSFFYNKQRVFLAPNINWKGYDLSWS